MTKSKHKKIKPQIKNSGYGFVVAGEKPENKKICVSFKYFKSHCVSINEFNNCYENEQAARKATSDFFKMLNDISNEDTNSMFSGSKKHQLHLNILKDARSVGLINSVLLEGYGFPNETVKEFEREYFEIVADGDGGRLIFVREDNVIDPLFIDANHMICPKVSRDLERKMLFGHPGLLHFSQKQNAYYEEEEMKRNLVKMLIKEARKEKIDSVADFLKQWDGIVGEEFEK